MRVAWWQTRRRGVRLEAQVQELVLGQVVRYDLRGADADVPDQVREVACAQAGAGGAGPGALRWRAEPGPPPSPALAKRQVDLCSGAPLMLRAGGVEGEQEEGGKGGGGGLTSIEPCQEALVQQDAAVGVQAAMVGPRRQVAVRLEPHLHHVRRLRDADARCRRQHSGS